MHLQSEYGSKAKELCKNYQNLPLAVHNWLTTEYSMALLFQEVFQMIL
jgi:hypothetical protein